EFTKDEILEMYLNVIYFGQGQYGVEAASNKFFYKSVEDLEVEEAALLAGMIKAPNGYSPIEHPEKAKERRNVVLDLLVNNETITRKVAEEKREKYMNLEISERNNNPLNQSIVDMTIKEETELYDITEE